MQVDRVEDLADTLFTLFTDHSAHHFTFQY